MQLPTSLDTNDFFEQSIQACPVEGDRKKLLLAIADKIVSIHDSTQQVHLNFICTHNSRRSQLAQVWSFFAADYFQLPQLHSFSGGTEATAFHRNTVKTLQAVGFTFEVVDFSHQNPKYAIRFTGSKNSLLAFSKTFDDATNTKPFIAITTCNDADENCPFIADAQYRFHLPFVDPKASDGTNEESETYLACNQKIASEIFFVFEAVQQKITIT